MLQLDRGEKKKHGIKEIGHKNIGKPREGKLKGKAKHFVVSKRGCFV